MIALAGTNDYLNPLIIYLWWTDGEHLDDPDWVRNTLKEVRTFYEAANKRDDLPKWEDSLQDVALSLLELSPRNPAMESVRQLLLTSGIKSFREDVDRIFAEQGFPLNLGGHWTPAQHKVYHEKQTQLVYEDLERSVATKVLKQEVLYSVTKTVNSMRAKLNLLEHHAQERASHTVEPQRTTYDLSKEEALELILAWGFSSTNRTIPTAMKRKLLNLGIWPLTKITHALQSPYANTFKRFLPAMVANASKVVLQDRVTVREVIQALNDHGDVTCANDFIDLVSRLTTNQSLKEDLKMVKLMGVV